MAPHLMSANFLTLSSQSLCLSNILIFYYNTLTCLKTHLFAVWYQKPMNKYDNLYTYKIIQLCVCLSISTFVCYHNLYLRKQQDGGSSPFLPTSQEHLSHLTHP